MEIGTVRQISIDAEMQSAYLDYAMSVIVARALPDVRDGLKPVHRRILYALHDMGLSPEKPYKKSARIVGEVLGKYHPHGDAAVYEAMARMAQDFSLRYTMVDGQGNFGSVDGDSPAAMRYTEARMAHIAQEMLADIDKSTVDFVPNFDDTLSEPSVLPAALPNLLVNGASGIAVGMTTNIPPHNLGEVCDALVYLIDHYDDLEDVAVQDLTQFIQGPDFPTGGVVYRYAEEDGEGEQADLIRNAYALGRGRLTVQAQVHIEEMSRNRSRIVITELPYQVNKTRLIERIADLVRDGKLDGITDLRDESDRQGMRLCLELTRTVEPKSVLSELFRHTPMQMTFSLRMLALVDGEPRLLPLKRVLLHYLEHRQDIIARRTRHLLVQAKERAHILEGLLKALDHIDEVIAIIRRSQTTDEARNELMVALTLSQPQAQAILDMPLKRLTSLERRRINQEHDDLLQEIGYLQDLLSSPAKIRAVAREDLINLKARYGDARRTRIVDREKGHHTARELLQEENVVLTLWRDGRMSRTSERPDIASAAVPVTQTRGSTRNDVAIFSAGGRAVLIPLHQLPDDQLVPVSSLAELEPSEAPIAALIVPHPQPGEDLPNIFLTLVTRGGRIKRVALADFLSVAGRSAITVMNLDPGDQLAWVGATDGLSDLLLVTRRGQAIRFPEEDVRPMGLAAAGVWAIKLRRDDAVVGVGAVADGSYVAVFSEKGHAKRTPVVDFPAQRRYGGGVKVASLSAKTGHVAVAAVVGEQDELVLGMSQSGTSTVPVAAIPILTRAASGSDRRADTGEPFLLTPEESPVSLALLVSPDAGV